MKVELVSKTQGIGKYENLSNEEIISAIARHGVIKEDNGKLVKYLMDNKHWSPLEQINFAFEIETSRAIGRHILRHDLKVQEHSQRYSDRVEFEHIELRKEHPTNRQSSTLSLSKINNTNGEITYNINCYGIDYNKIDKYSVKVRNLIKEINEVYKEGIELGIAKECARMILPECTTTTMTFNGCLRNWLTFSNVRLDEHAQKEVRDIATEIGNILEKELPNIFKSIEWRNGMFM